LRDTNAFFGVCNFKTKEIFDNAKIFDLKTAIQDGFDSLNFFQTSTSQYGVINIDE
jgi:hypothetical protein